MATVLSSDPSWRGGNSGMAAEVEDDDDAVGEMKASTMASPSSNRRGLLAGGTAEEQEQNEQEAAAGAAAAEGGHLGGGGGSGFLRPSLPTSASMQYMSNKHFTDKRTLKDKRKCPYTDSLETTHLGWVQTPQYFEDCYEIKVLGDPCGHRNAVFFDAVQCGLDGYGSALFAGTNAMFRRAAFDSIGGVKYGTLTEDSFTGFTLNRVGWDSAYFRKDWEGSADERFALASGLVPESVAATFKQRKRWAQGSCEIHLMDKSKPDLLMDKEWWEEFKRDNPVEVPPSGAEREWKFRFMRGVFYFNTM